MARTARRATLVLHGTVRQDDATSAVRLCLALPAHVRAIELDARDVRDLSDDARSVLVALVRAWRRGRRGQVSIRASTATVLLLGEREPVAHDGVALTPCDNGDHLALTATFL
ncbi:MAG TPA: hypothetical protein VLN49_16440 [Gemmatimonadaceae bacterium]|nr:hypothetical protein [Gemmatimonadaceae bacterium]